MAKKAKKEDFGDSLDLAQKELIKKYGNVINTLSEYEDEPIKTVSTGCISLDLALGNGGVALGRIYEFYGPYSSGKTTLALSVIVQAQKRGLKCMFLDAEHSLDKELAAGYGVKLDQLLYARAYTGEDNLNILEKCVESNEIDVAVVDSVSALIPTAEAEADIEDMFVGQHARLMSKALRRLAPLASKTNTMIIFINQLRNKIMRNSYGNPETTTGGEALNFYATGRISVRGPEAKSRRLSDKDINDGEVYGHETIFSIEKNKLSAPFKEARVNLIYGKGYDIYHELAVLATDLGIFDKRGSWYKYKDNNIANGERAISVFLEENVDLFNEVKDEVMASVGLKEIYERHQR